MHKPNIERKIWKNRQFNTWHEISTPLHSIAKDTKGKNKIKTWKIVRAV